MRTARLWIAVACLTVGGCSQASSASSALTGAGGAGGADSEAPCDLEDIAPEDCATVHAMRLPAVPPPARGNRYADDDDAAYLGFKLFFSTDLGTGVGCPTCHLPELAFTDRKPISTGKQEGTRNAPTVFNAADLRVMFWDGRGDSLWSQPLFAIENPLEMASTRLELAHFVAKVPDVRSRYEQVFGELPDVASWPPVGKPGDPAFDDLPAATQVEVNRLAANVGKAFEAYMRKNRTAESAFDKWLDGDASKLIPAARRGLRTFLELGCAHCHSGPMLTDEGFHGVDFPSLPGAQPDAGRAAAIDILRQNPFNLAGPYADPGPGVPGDLPSDAGEQGAFRTPSLRNVTRTEPYGHDGALASLREVLAVHAPNVDADAAGELLALFQTFNGDYPYPPWNNWPSPQ